MCPTVYSCLGRQEDQQLPIRAEITNPRYDEDGHIQQPSLFIFSLIYKYVQVFIISHPYPFQANVYESVQLDMLTMTMVKGIKENEVYYFGLISSCKSP